MKNHDEETFHLLNLLPKIEIHLHLLGCISDKTLKKLGIPEIGNNGFQGLTDFVKKYLDIIKGIKEEEYINYVFDDLEEYLESNNIFYAEVFWAPSFFLKNNLDFFKIIQILKKRSKKAKTHIKFLIDISRTFGVRNAESIAEKTMQIADDKVIGIGLGGDELKTETSKFKNIFQDAKNKGLRVVAHAGEGKGQIYVRNVYDAIELLSAERIGHGIAIADDEDAIEFVKSHNIPLEICPSSNFKLGIIKNMENHPVRFFYDKGLKFTLNSDDPTFYNTTLSKEFYLLYKYLNFSLDDIKNIAMNSAEQTFMDSALKKEYQSILEKFYK